MSLLNIQESRKEQTTSEPEQKWRLFETCLVSKVCVHPQKCDPVSKVFFTRRDLVLHSEPPNCKSMASSSLLEIVPKCSFWFHDELASFENSDIS